MDFRIQFKGSCCSCVTHECRREVPWRNRKNPEHSLKLLGDVDFVPHNAQLFSTQSEFCINSKSMKP